MERCASCGRELASQWKFCVYCGRPFIAGSTEQESRNFSRADSDHAVRPPRKFDVAFWVGIGIGVLGVAVIIYAAIQIYSAPG